MVGDVERAGNRIILSGLGPSSRAINRRDTTVIDVWAEDGVTAIGADVSFQASSFLGDSGQEEIVRLKLERLFEETEEQIDFERRRAEARFERMQILASTGTAVGYERENEREPESFAVMSPDASPIVTMDNHSRDEIVDDLALPADIAAQSDESITLSSETLTDVGDMHPESASAVELNSEVAEIPVAEVPEPATGSLLEAVAPEAPEIADPPAKAAVITAEPPAASTEETIETAETESMRRHEPIASEANDAQEEEVVVEVEGGSKSTRWIVWGLLAACIPAFLPFGVHYFHSWRAGSEVNRPISVVSTPKVVASAPAHPAPAADPAELLRQWELAMRSTDAAAQAAFYAVPVERYLTRNNLGKEAVQADKQAGIDKRKGHWTVKMERVKISRQSDTEVTANFLKHFIEQEDGKPVKEWFIPSRLKLRNEYGIWWITSESDLGWVNSPDDL